MSTLVIGEHSPRPAGRSLALCFWSLQIASAGTLNCYTAAVVHDPPCPILQVRSVVDSPHHPRCIVALLIRITQNSEWCLGTFGEGQLPLVSPCGDANRDTCLTNNASIFD